MVRVHFGPPLQIGSKNGSQADDDRGNKGENAKMDSKGGTWQQSGGLLQPPWLSRRKASLGPPLLIKEEQIWGFSSAGRAPALQAGGQRFDPGTLHQKKSKRANSSAG